MNQPIIFWQRNRYRAKELAAFALRLFNTPANSVPNKRSFSTINYIVHKNRIKLSTERSDQSIYIYMNQRALRKAYEMGSKSWANLSDNDAIDIEDSILELLDQKEALEDQIEGD